MEKVTGSIAARLIAWSETWKERRRRRRRRMTAVGGEEGGRGGRGSKRGAGV